MSYAYIRNLKLQHTSMFTYYDNEDNAFSVRCVQD